MEPPLPYATPALAKAVWEHQSSASARSVARALGAAGYPVHWVTVARWRRTGWLPIGPARRQPLADAPRGVISTIVPGALRATGWRTNQSPDTTPAWKTYFSLAAAC